MRRIESRGRRSRRWTARVASLAGVLGLAEAGLAQTPLRTILEWNAPSGCPGADALYQSLEDGLGQTQQLGRLSHVRASIEKRATDWLLRLDLVAAEQQGTRLISAERCEDLPDAAALAVQLALTSAATEPLAAPNDAAGPTNTLPLAVAPSLAPSASPADAAGEPSPSRPGVSVGSHLEVSLAAEGVLDLNCLPELSPGASLAGRARWDRFELGLYALWLAESTVAVSGGESVGFGLIAGGPRGCYRGLEGALSGYLCVAFEVGRFNADGSDLSRDERSFSQWWLAPSVGLELRARLSPLLFAQGRAEVIRPLVRRDYGVNVTDVVYEPPLLGARFYLGLGLAVE